MSRTTGAHHAGQIVVERVAAIEEPAEETLVSRPEQSFPRLLPRPYTPEDLDPDAPASLPVLQEWIDSNRSRFESDLLRCGGVLFRGFQIGSAEAFQTIVERLGANLLNYVVGNSPRTKVSDKVYTSTEYPATESIPLHNELSYLQQWPSKLFFFCLVAPASRGETPIADSRRILAALDPQTRQKFEKKGLQYIQNLHGGNQRLGKSWQAAFESEDKSVVEQVCAEKEVDFEWKADGGLRLVHNRQAVAVHPITKEPVWFNQADLWHPSRFPPATRRVLMSMFQADDMPNYVRYGDGSEIDAGDFARVSEASEAESVVFPWQVGDVLMLDNMLAAHGRSPFSGPRKILVAMS